MPRQSSQHKMAVEREPLFQNCVKESSGSFQANVRGWVIQVTVIPLTFLFLLLLEAKRANAISLSIGQNSIFPQRHSRTLVFISLLCN